MLILSKVLRNEPQFRLSSTQFLDLVVSLVVWLSKRLLLQYKDPFPARFLSSKNPNFRTPKVKESLQVQCLIHFLWSPQAPLIEACFSKFLVFFFRIFLIHFSSRGANLPSHLLQLAHSQHRQSNCRKEIQTLPWKFKLNQNWS